VEEDYCGFVPRDKARYRDKSNGNPYSGKGFIILQWLEGDIGEWRRFAMMEYCSV